MSCPGLHCPGCSGSQSAGIAAAVVVALAVAAEAVQWVADRIWWIGGTAAVCYAMAVVAGTRLERRNDRRAAAWGAARGIYSRADVILPCPVRAAAVPAEPARPAIAAPGITVNIFGVPSPEQAEVIRQVLPEPGGAARGEALRLVTRNPGIDESGAGTLA
ncbi:MAG TPA: hypothetical protein VGF32_24330 [Streptosporangiaceae bacterium]|jgi:hypothetical protein